jgi:hypothetical protein
VLVWVCLVQFSSVIVGSKETEMLREIVKRDNLFINVNLIVLTF